MTKHDKYKATSRYVFGMVDYRSAEYTDQPEERLKLSDRLRVAVWNLICKIERIVKRDK